MQRYKRSLKFRVELYKPKETKREEEWKQIPGFSRYEVSNDGLYNEYRIR